MKQKWRVVFCFRISQGPKRAKLGFGTLTYTLYEGKTRIIEKSTKIRCKQYEFDPDFQKFVGENARDMNLELGRIKEKIGQDMSKYLIDGDSRPLFKGFKYENVEFKNELKLLIDLVDEYIQVQEGKIRKPGEKKHIGTLEASTHRKYAIFRDNALVPYMQKFAPKLIRLKDVDLMFVENYNTFLVSTKTYQKKTRQQPYANKCVKFLKTVMRYAATAGYIYNNVTEQYRNKRETPKPVRTLSPEDVEKLRNCQILSDPEIKTIDVFLFCKETFLHIGDFQDLKSSHIKTDKDGDKWIVKDRIKAQEEGRQVQRVPLTKIALDIIEKYGSVEAMPHYVNGTFNYYLKMAAEKAGIEYITFKMARSSGISEAYNEKSLRGESIAVAAGWTTTKELRTYLSIDYGQLKNEFIHSKIAPNNGSMYQI